MLKLLLDEHISPAVAAGLRFRHPSLFIVGLTEWKDGEFLGQSDAVCLQEAAAQQLTLVTYDQRTIPPLLKAWGEEGQANSGVIVVDEKTISPADIGGQVRALSSLFCEAAKWDWNSGVVFLRR